MSPKSSRTTFCAIRHSSLSFVAFPLEQHAISLQSQLHQRRRSDPFPLQGLRDFLSRSTPWHRWSAPSPLKARDTNANGSPLLLLRLTTWLSETTTPYRPLNPNRKIVWNKRPKGSKTDGRLGLNLYGFAVVGKPHALGQASIGLIMQSDSVAHVSKIGAFGPYPLRKCHGFLHRHVAMMPFFPP